MKTIYKAIKERKDNHKNILCKSIVIICIDENGYVTTSDKGSFWLPRKKLNKKGVINGVESVDVDINTTIYSNYKVIAQL